MREAKTSSSSNTQTRQRLFLHMHVNKSRTFLSAVGLFVTKKYSYTFIWHFKWDIISWKLKINSYFQSRNWFFAFFCFFFALHDWLAFLAAAYRGQCTHILTHYDKYWGPTHIHANKHTNIVSSEKRARGELPKQKVENTGISLIQIFVFFFFCIN